MICSKCHRNMTYDNSYPVEDGVWKYYYVCECGYTDAKTGRFKDRKPAEKSVYKPDLWWESLPSKSLDKCKSNTDFWHENPNKEEKEDVNDEYTNSFYSNNDVRRPNGPPVKANCIKCGIFAELNNMSRCEDCQYSYDNAMNDLWKDDD